MEFVNVYFQAWKKNDAQMIRLQTLSTFAAQPFRAASERT